MEKEQIYQLLTKEVGLEFVKKEEPMSKHTSFKIGGNADIFVIIKNEDILKNVLKIAREQNVPLTILGNGTNVLVKDNGIRGLVAKIDIQGIEIKKYADKVIVIAGAGVKNAILAQQLLKEEISGFEFAAGIPGTIGGATYMNAGAYGGEMKNIVTEVTYIDEQEDMFTATNKECEFDYRFSIFSTKRCVITKVKMELTYGKQDEIKMVMEQNAKSRKEKQPMEFPSVGSTFKRGKDFITAKLIDECGLKGYQIGDAQISTLHAGFIINKGKATAEDVLQLVEYVQKKVYDECGKKIELEMKVIGE